jgi:aspartate racemase
MPEIKPSGGEVFWPEDEGVLGVVGVAPWATLEFCKIFYKKINAIKDWHYPRVLLDINTKLPSRGRYFQLHETNPSPFIAKTIDELYEQGATVAVVPCNTAHILYEEWAKDSLIPVLHIVRETLSMVADAGINSITPFTSSSLAENNLISSLSDELGIECRRLNEDDQYLVSRIIENIKIFGNITKKNNCAFKSLINRIKSDDIGGVIIGCTELTILGEKFLKNNIPFFDSNEALANAAIKSLKLPKERIF